MYVRLMEFEGQWQGIYVGFKCMQIHLMMRVYNAHIA